MPSENFNVFSEAGDFANQASRIAFTLRRFMDSVRIATIVRVLAVTNDGSVSPVGSVDVQPLVQQTDGEGNVIALPPVYGVPYIRVQGGTNAVIIDPQVGDLGIALFGDRDLSTVVSTKDMGPPGSARRNSLADALYIGGLLNVTPVQFVQFTDSGITVKSPTLVTIDAPKTKTTHDLEVGGDLKVTGTTELQGAVTADDTITASGEVKSGNIGLQAHHHTAQGATSPTTPSQP